MKSYMTLAIVAAVAVMLFASAAVAAEDAFATKKREYNQATSQANACGNGELPLNVFCQNIGSQVQGDENAVAASGAQD
jgi:ABC-type Na+ efflux pump permease subunit